MDIEGWVHNIPIVTKLYMVGALAISIGLTFDLVSPLSLYLGHTQVWQRGEYWRLLTTFLFFGKIDVGFFFNMHFLYFYSRRLEEHFYFNRTGEFVCLLLTAALTLLGISYFVPMMFLSQPLIMVILYIWARRFPDELLSIYGIFTVTSAYLPFVMCGLAYLINGGDAVRVDLYAIAVGHVLWYLADVLPQITGVHLLSPSFVLALFQPRRHAVE
uniref:Derlin n=1 Tax=Neobodo designis TaxID=312471 RepID=A0A7S1M5I4_NEODS|mmetsp:Transcript_34312/g.106022  ORF Transcript_34312/g.106022 Transcript_34312/m.106022 type:complete len:215 (+) Transcript_34312:131-775(+)